MLGRMAAIPPLSSALATNGKEEHSNPALEPSASRDAIEDAIAAKVKPECLKTPPNRLRI